MRFTILLLVLVATCHSEYSKVGDQQEGCVPGFRPPPEPYFYDNIYLNESIDKLPDWSIKQMKLLLNESLTMFSTDYPVGFTCPWGEDVFYGSSGRALLYLRLYASSFDEKYLELAKGHNDFALSVSRKKFDPDYVGFLKGRSGMLAIGIMIYSYIGDNTTISKYYEELIGIFDQVTIDTAFQFDNGIAGLMAMARILNNFFTMSINHPEKRKFGGSENKTFIIPEELITKVGEVLFARGIKYYNQSIDSLQYGTYTGLGVGGANGGPTYEIMRNPTLMSNSTIRKYIQRTMEYYLTQQLENGNMISDPGYPDRVQWCHGSPGFIGVFLEANRNFKDEKYLVAAMKAADFTHKEGTLKKGMLLGHGIVGNIYMMLDLYGEVGDPKLLSKAFSMLLTALQTTEATDLSKMISYDCVPGSFWLSSTGGMVTLFLDVLDHLEDLSVLKMPVFG